MSGDTERRSADDRQPGLFLGIEIGGTKLQAAVGNGDGRLQSLLSAPAEPAGGQARIAEQIVELTEQLRSELGSQWSRVRAAGIGFGGPVDYCRQRTITSNQVAGWDDVPLVDWFQDRFGLPTFLLNDADAAALAEATLGAGRGSSPVVYMNIGSGIGGGLVIAGELHLGQGRGAVEIGHLRVRPGADGKSWTTLEECASGWSVARTALQLLPGHPDSQLWSVCPHDLTLLTGAHVWQAAGAGDALANEVVDHAIDALAVALANVITLLAPECVVIGGGVAQVGDLLFTPLRQEVNDLVFAPFRQTYRIVPAAFGQEVVLHGAICQAAQKLRS